MIRRSILIGVRLAGAGKQEAGEDIYAGSHEEVEQELGFVIEAFDVFLVVCNFPLEGSVKVAFPQPQRRCS